jgi:DNA mismatch repair protein MSH6
MKPVTGVFFNPFLSVAKVSKFDKVVKREICQITAKGTRVFSVIDGDANDAENNYLLALTEKVSKVKVK